MSSLIEDTAHRIKTVQHRHHRALDGALAELGITLVQWNALREIERHPGASMHALAEATFNSDQAFGTLAKRLLEAGLIDRRRGSGRVLTHELTTKGQDLLDQGYAKYIAVMTAAFHGLSSGQILELQELLGRIG
ncbi:MarR family winged helix-turn-helix transcriptional regulator [Granulibacter bethesdensis]|nr:MarR family transcriptional regulator [Granulibacter bethesdensis]